MRKSPIIILLVLAVAACAPDDRCGDEYDFVDGVCVIPDTDSDTDTGPEPDGGNTDDTGIGEVCTSDGNECDDLDADYCAAQPGADEGYCTFDNCAADESICPSPYQCCDMGSLSFCASPSDYSALSGLGICQE